MDTKTEIYARRVNKDYKFVYGTGMHNSISLTVLKSMMDYGLFAFLETPRTLKEIMDHFRLTDQSYLLLILNAFVNDRYLDNNNDSYSVNIDFLKQINDPKIYNEKMAVFNNIPALKKTAENYANAIPDRLKGKYKEFADNKTTVKWDLALKDKFYKDLRDANLAFSNALNRQGRFLDVGSGNGVGLLDIWLQYHKKQYFEQSSKRKIALYGIEPNENLREIAQKEWDIGLMEILQQDRDQIKKRYGHTFPQFFDGTAHAIPFEDNFFDIIYSSYVLHFDDTELALKEMYRVLKPGGVVVGNEYPDDYTPIISQLMPGAIGSFTKDQYDRILKDIKAKNVRFIEVFPQNQILFFKYSK